MRSIQLTFARLDIHDDIQEAETIFPDGASYGALPHHGFHYCALAKETGYGDDIWAYCRDHELLHNLLPEAVNGTPSHVLWHLAHGTKPDPWKVWQEEALVIGFQRFLTGRDETMPATAPGVDRYLIRAKALELLGSVQMENAA